jgi:hypothetical protein
VSTAVAPTIPTGSLAAHAQASVAFDADFTQRVAVLGSRYAVQVLSEASAVDNHDLRAIYARLFLGAPKLISENQLSWAVCSDLATNGANSDLEIVERIAAVWDSVSGVGVA